MYGDDLITVEDFIQDKYYVKINGIKGKYCTLPLGWWPHVVKTTKK